MDIKVLKNDGFRFNGSGLLRAFQNDEMPSLDLLIREAVQNSMDARRNDKSFVKEEINVDQFNAEKVADFFPEIYAALRIKARLQGYNKYISISDKNTLGLTGPIRIKDTDGLNWGRFLSLVQGIARPQENRGAGGSWGYGKTVYYRIGVGLVIYYSRVLDDGKYKSRLMACLVENEKDKNSMLNNSKRIDSNTGIALWGIKDKQDDDNVIPIENEEKIKEILDCFNLKLYQGDETGTIIIIPYINENKLLSKTNSKYNDDINLPFWCKSLEDYLPYAVQKWYPTKIINIEGSSNYISGEDHENKIEANPWLDLYINGKRFVKMDMLPLFEIMQDLYNYIVKDGYEPKYDIKEESIKLNNIFLKNKPAGKLVYVYLTEDELKMHGADNEESPYTQVTNEIVDEENNTNIIIGFCRRPGMILRYSINDEWTNGIVNPKPNTYVIALFVPNGYNEIEVIDDKEKYIIELEEYLRYCEEADHNNWKDIGEFNYENIKKIDVSNLKIVTKIQKGIKTKIKNELKIEEKETIINVGTVLSRQLTKWFLPKKGFGKGSLKQTPRGENEKKLGIPTKREKKSKIDLKYLEVTDKLELFKRFSLTVNSNDAKLEYNFKVVTENENINANDWEITSNNKFPLEISKIEIDNIVYEDGTIKEIKQQLQEDNNLNIVFNKNISQIYNIWYGFKLNILDESITNINGKIYYKTIDSNIEVNIEREKGINNE